MDHEKSQQEPEFLQAYVNGNCKLISDWLDRSGITEYVGFHLLFIMLEHLTNNEKTGVSGMTDGYIINLFHPLPGGDFAAGRLIAQRAEVGLQIPSDPVPLYTNLPRQQPISVANMGNCIKRGPKARNCAAML